METCTLLVESFTQSLKLWLQATLGARSKLVGCATIHVKDRLYGQPRCHLLANSNLVIDVAHNCQCIPVTAYWKFLPRSKSWPNACPTTPPNMTVSPFMIHTFVPCTLKSLAIFHDTHTHSLQCSVSWSGTLAWGTFHEKNLTCATTRMKKMTHCHTLSMTSNFKFLQYSVYCTCIQEISL
jgi:hypothetical protein